MHYKIFGKNIAQIVASLPKGATYQIGRRGKIMEVNGVLYRVFDYKAEAYLLSKMLPA